MRVSDVDTSKKQHYVWQFYLKPWASKNKIWCLRQKEPKLFGTGTSSIAAETFFYKNENLTLAEITYIEMIIKKASNPMLRDVHQGTLQMFRAAHEMEYMLLQQRLPPERKQAIREHFDRIHKTLGESFHTFLEERMKNTINQLRIGDCSFYKIEGVAMEFINFLMHQLTRTPKLLDVSRKIAPLRPDLDLTKLCLIESHIFATNLAWGILQEHQAYGFFFLENRIGYSFITGDQPIVNLNDPLTHNDVRLYYPLSPHRAVVFEKTSPLRSKLFCTEEDVSYLNDRIFALSTDQIYGKDESSLEKFYVRPPKVEYLPAPF